MKTKTTLLLPAVDDDPQFWIDLLVDDELGACQRLELLNFLKSNPAMWQVCAQSFMDDQLIESEVKQNLGSCLPDSPVEKPKSTLGPGGADRRARRSRGPGSLGPGWLALAVSLVFLVGWFSSWLMSNHGTERQVSDAKSFEQELAEIAATYEEVYEIAAERQRRNSAREIETQLAAIRSMNSRNKLLIEIEDTDERAVFYTENRLPDYLLEALVMAGHQVEIKQKMLEFTKANGKPFGYPIHSIEINKFALLSSTEPERNKHVD